jgi:hypothetical protein
MDAASLIDSLLTRGCLENFMAYILDERPERFSKSVVAVDHQYFSANVRHEGT